MAMSVLGNGLSTADHYEEALSVQEAELSVRRRLGDSEHNMLVAQGNLAITYRSLGRHEEALLLRQEVYSGRLKFNGEEDERTLTAANNYAISLGALERFEEAKSLMRRIVPVARRVLGESSELTLKMRWIYAETLVFDAAATLDDLSEAVKTLEDAERIARRVLGGAHPVTEGIERHLRKARAALRARETPSPRV
jgi:tetratricopeptide (TPR) repeat protein